MEDRINLKTLQEFLAFEPMKKMITRLLVSISIFSLMFSYSFLYSQNFNYFSSNSFYHILNRAMNKNCIFFICNGILVFLAKTSGFVLSPPSTDFDPNEMLQKKIGDSLEIAIHETESESLLERDHVTLMEESCETSKDQEQEQEQEKEQEQDQEKCLNERAEDEVSIFIAESDDEEFVENDEHDSLNCWLFHDEPQQEVYGQEEEQQVHGQEEEEEEEEEEEQVYEQEAGGAGGGGDGKEEKLEMLSTEELNKKFDDFIRKMKKEMRINEVRHQQLLMVN
ncbi:hypothetical protein CDL12_15322 [Handroanthus impetiginosus]|uniref:DUF4408 domain-containing protein n=1 Tax=Handroanthus impetiginosus TaxID=429701 RepID=A0A2G9H3I1_9LAMI|nr:hypothetical protein CDL12_15322 [Handroanthus impetiginosus]